MRHLRDSVHVLTLWGTCLLGNAVVYFENCGLLNQSLANPRTPTIKVPRVHSGYAVSGREPKTHTFGGWGSKVARFPAGQILFRPMDRLTIRKRRTPERSRQ